MTLQVKFRMNEGDQGLAPSRAHEGDAAFDLRANAPCIISPGSTELVPTGLFLELPLGYEAQIRPRSGLALKNGITITNSPGTIDAGYRGEVGIILHNTGAEDFVIRRGDRIAQMVIQSLPDVELVPAETLAGSSRGSGGFGSTGTG